MKLFLPMPTPPPALEPVEIQAIATSAHDMSLKPALEELARWAQDYMQEAAEAFLLRPDDLELGPPPAPKREDCEMLKLRFICPACHGFGCWRCAS